MATGAITKGATTRALFGKTWRHPPNFWLRAKPLTLRSLVGMTQGARKRAWLAGTLYPVVFPSGISTTEEEMRSGYSWSEIRSYWGPVTAPKGDDVMEWPTPLRIQQVPCR